MASDKDLPDTLERSAEKIQRTYKKALENAEEQYDGEERAQRTAWSQVKHIAEKRGDHWELKEEKGPSDSRDKQESTEEKAQGKGETHGGVDVEHNSKEELYERAQELGIAERSKMDKKELADAIAQKQD